MVKTWEFKREEPPPLRTCLPWRMYYMVPHPHAQETEVKNEELSGWAIAGIVAIVVILLIGIACVTE